MNRSLRLGFWGMLILVGLTLPVRAQSNMGIGQFQLHLPYQQATAVAETPEQIYCATEGGFFSFDKEYNSLKTLSRMDGFSDNNVQTLRYDSVTATLVIVYRNTNIDLVRDGRITNVNDVLRKQMTGQKMFFHVHFRNRLAYLSGSFGLVVLDLERREIRDTYSNLGAGGQAVEVYASTSRNDSLFVATSQGVLAARIPNNNLLDYRNWVSFPPSSGLPAGTVQTITTQHGQVYAGVNRIGVYRFNGRVWEATPLPAQGQDIVQLRPVGSELLMATPTSISLLAPNGGTRPLQAPLLTQPRDGLKSGNGSFWLADYARGLIHVPPTGEARSLIPNGPFHRNVFQIYTDEQSTLVFGGGYDESYQQRNSPIGFYELREGQWMSYNSIQTPSQFPAVNDLVGGVRNPLNGKLYLASYGYGLIQWNGPGDYTIFNNENSPLLSSLRDDNRFVRIPAVAADVEGNIWVTNRNQILNSPGLHVLRPDQTWESFAIPAFPEASNVEKMIIDDNGYKWMIVSHFAANPGILVFDDKTKRHRHLTAGNSGLPNSQVNALAQDRNGEMWVGTNDGVAIFQAPHQVFSTDFRAAYTPIIEGRPLLNGQVIRCIAVDGGNRKWIGTSTGLWLFNAFGDEVIHHFTPQNSALPSERITALSIDHRTGVLFIGTEAGLVSYRGGATITQEVTDCANVFPNPVRPGFTGMVGISGLPNNANVKITDVAGVLVYETKAEGGTATWNVRDYNGRRVQSGVYLVMSTLPDGSQGCISKVAVLK